MLRFRIMAHCSGNVIEEHGSLSNTSSDYFGHDACGPQREASSSGHLNDRG
jgi:hypothetical protein